MIELSLAGLNVKLSKFLNNDYPRVIVQPTSVEYSAYGVPVITGIHHQNKYLWSVNAICDRNQRDLLETIWWESEERQRKITDGNILIYDSTATIKEKTPRTRAIVPNTTTIAIGTNYVSYFAQFKGLIISELKFTKAGVVDTVSFSIAETDLVSL